MMTVGVVYGVSRRCGEPFSTEPNGRPGGWANTTTKAGGRPDGGLDGAEETAIDRAAGHISMSAGRRVMVKWVMQSSLAGDGTCPAALLLPSSSSQGHVTGTAVTS